MALKADFISSTWVVGFNVMEKFCTIFWYCNKCPPNRGEVLLSLVSSVSDNCQVLDVFSLILNLIKPVIGSFGRYKLIMCAGFDQFAFV
ncbi:MAG: hypothetical protein RL609_1843 [Bacteroidota bacterium]